MSKSNGENILEIEIFGEPSYTIINIPNIENKILYPGFKDNFVTKNKYKCQMKLFPVP